MIKFESCLNCGHRIPYKKHKKAICLNAESIHLIISFLCLNRNDRPFNKFKLRVGSFEFQNEKYMEENFRNGCVSKYI